VSRSEVNIFADDKSAAEFHEGDQLGREDEPVPAKKIVPSCPLLLLCERLYLFFSDDPGTRFSTSRYQYFRSDLLI
jgi:hypothetical protein